MKRIFVLGLILLLGSQFAWSAFQEKDVEKMWFRPFYWVIATVQCKDAAINANSRTAVIFDNNGTYNEYNIQSYVINNLVIMNAFALNLELEVGQEYRFTVPKDPAKYGDDYGLDPVKFTISQDGYTDLGVLNLVAGEGPPPPPPPPTAEVFEKAPQVKYKFGNRVYQKDLIAKWKAEKKSFVVSKTPELKVDVGIDSPFALSNSSNDYKLYLDPSTDNKEFSITNTNMTQKVMTQSPERLKAFTLNYNITEALSEGEHVFKVIAKSSGLDGIQATATELATVEVLGGPLRLVGDPVVFPSPFSKPRDNNLTIQYTLSADADIDIYIIDVGGRRVKKFSCASGQDGGTAGINKLVWDASSSFGGYLSNGIYVGTIIAKEENKLLGKLKLTVVN